MSARLSRSRAVIAVAVFATIVAAWATVQARSSTAGADIIPHCITVGNTGNPAQDCTQEYTGVSPYDVAAAAPGLAAGTATGNAEDAEREAGYALNDPGYGPAGSPGAAGAPVSDAAGLWEDSGGDPFATSRACAALGTDASQTANNAVAESNEIRKDPVLWAQENILKQPSGTSSRSAAFDCNHENRYACWSDYAETHRHYTSAIYWDWVTHIGWCGYSLGSITSHDYSDHWGGGPATGFNCAVKDERRLPVEKINKGHWQEHSNFTFRCEVGGLFKEDRPQDGFHFYSNGYSKAIENGGD